MKGNPQHDLDEIRHLASMDIKVVSIRLVSTDKPLRAVVAVAYGDMVIQEWRLVMNGRLVLEPPRHSWRDQETGDIRYKPLVTVPLELKQIIDGEVIRRYREELERIDAREQNR